MSRFFRSLDPDESSTSESGSNSDDEARSPRPSFEQSNTSESRELTSSSFDTIARESEGPSTGWHRDLLLHALLEERCLHDILRERNVFKHNIGEDLQREARARYQSLCAQLAPLGLVSSDFDEDEHRPLRQKYRDGLDLLAQTRKAPERRKPSLSANNNKLLTEGGEEPTHTDCRPMPQLQHSNQVLGPDLLFQDFSPVHQYFTPSRYLREFDEIGILGAGGYGKVYHVKHRLDGRPYAVKKVPFHPAAIARVQSPGGQAAMEQILAEVRALSQLDHPNVVRYFGSWIEWTANTSSISSSSEDGQPNIKKSEDGKFESNFSMSFSTESLHRVITQSNTDDDIGVSFESRSENNTSFEISTSIVPSSGVEQIELASPSNTNGALITNTGPALALHMQMDVYPMTLAEYLSPQPTDSSVAPLAHCFHLQPSVHILLAIFDGVEYLHSEGIVHRDLKPANIFLRVEESPLAARGCVDPFSCPACQSSKPAGPVKLSVRIGDFGLVSRIADNNSAVESSTAVGTEIYRPLASKSKISSRLDIFALGVIACELLCSFGTQMERRETLQRLKIGSFPARMADCSDKQCIALKGCISGMLSDEANHGTTIPELRAQLLSILALPSPTADAA